MTLETSLICGFILHLVGDYLLQNDWMAQNKASNSAICWLHCWLYSTPFHFIMPYDSAHNITLAGFEQINIWSPWLVIFYSHFFIDRFRLAVYWINLVNWNWDSTNFGYDNDKPPFMSIWLMIIIDNTFHVLFNSLCIYWAYCWEWKNITFWSAPLLSAPTVKRNSGQNILPRPAGTLKKCGLIIMRALLGPTSAGI